MSWKMSRASTANRAVSALRVGVHMREIRTSGLRGAPGNGADALRSTNERRPVTVAQTRSLDRISIRFSGSWHSASDLIAVAVIAVAATAVFLWFAFPSRKRQ